MRIGILDHESVHLGGSQHVVARMASALTDAHAVEIVHSGRGYDLAGLAGAFDVDLSRVSERVTEAALSDFAVPGDRPALPRLATGFADERDLTEPYDLFVYSGHRTPPLCHRGQGLIFCHFPFHARPSRARYPGNGAARAGVGRLVRRGIHERIWRRRMAGYPTVVANSRFTAGWIERLWGRRAEVVYPPVVGERADRPKTDTIVSVGRFTDTDRKNLRAQIRVLPRFLRAAGEGWTLCMAGFCGGSDRDGAFLADLRAETRGLPVRFLVNEPRERIFAALGEAKLFWHTTGLGEDEAVEPRYMEHFGIATAEAMRAGCVPLVPRCGGQPEIVAHGRTGYLCANESELADYSVRLARDDELRRRLAQHASERSLDFSVDVFVRRVRELVSAALASRSPQRARGGST